MKVMLKEKLINSGNDFILTDVDTKYIVNVEKNVASLQDKIVISNYMGDILYLIDKSTFSLYCEYGIYDSSTEIIHLKKELAFNKAQIDIQAIDTNIRIESSMQGRHIKLFINNELECKIFEHTHGFSKTFEIEIMNDKKKELVATVAMTICQMLNEKAISNKD